MIATICLEIFNWRSHDLIDLKGPCVNWSMHNNKHIICVRVYVCLLHIFFASHIKLLASSFCLFFMFGRTCSGKIMLLFKIKFKLIWICKQIINIYKATSRKKIVQAVPFIWCSGVYVCVLQILCLHLAAGYRMSSPSLRSWLAVSSLAVLQWHTKPNQTKPYPMYHGTAILITFTPCANCFSKSVAANTDTYWNAGFSHRCTHFR